MNYLASPPLVGAYALAGTMDIDFDTEPLGTDTDGNPVYLRDIWPSPEEIQEVIDSAIAAEMYQRAYSDVFAGDERWRSLPTPTGDTFSWDPNSPTCAAALLDGMPLEPEPSATCQRPRGQLGDSVTTDHISPAGAIKPGTPAAEYLMANGVERKDFNSYGSRRGNHEVMIRGTFANIRLRNQIAPGTEGGYTRDFTQEGGPVTFIYDAAQNYAAQNIPLVVLAARVLRFFARLGNQGTRLLGGAPSSPGLSRRIHRRA